MIDSPTLRINYTFGIYCCTLLHFAEPLYTPSIRLLAIFLSWTVDPHPRFSILTIFFKIKIRKQL